MRDDVRLDAEEADHRQRERHRAKRERGHPGGPAKHRSAGEDRPPGADHLDSEIRIDLAEGPAKGVHGHRGVSSRARDDREERHVALSQR